MAATTAKSDPNCATFVESTFLERLQHEESIQIQQGTTPDQFPALSNTTAAKAQALSLVQMGDAQSRQDEMAYGHETHDRLGTIVNDVHLTWDDLMKTVKKKPGFQHPHDSHVAGLSNHNDHAHHESKAIMTLFLQLESMVSEHLAVEQSSHHKKKKSKKSGKPSRHLRSENLATQTPSTPSQSVVVDFTITLNGTPEEQVKKAAERFELMKVDLFEQALFAEVLKANGLTELTGIDVLEVGVLEPKEYQVVDPDSLFKEDEPVTKTDAPGSNTGLIVCCAVFGVIALTASILFASGRCTKKNSANADNDPAQEPLHTQS
jgi:hypothetical protein